MNKVEEYIEKQNRIILKDREKTLISLGLIDKEYSPDNRERWAYSKYDYVDGEKRYYKEVPIKVTDEEYELIISKAKQVEEIKTKEEQERQKEQSKTSYRVTKKWMPVFEKQKNEGESNEEEDDGKSRIASILRIVAWLIGILSVLLGIFLAVEMEIFLPVIIAFGAGAIEMLMFYAIAAVLEYLAELTAIARNGFKYNESSK